MSNLSAKRIIFIDIETTGLKPKHGDKIIQIGCFYNKSDELTIERSFNQFVNPQRRISTSAMKCHRITDDMVKNSPKFAEIGQQFLDFINGSILVGHNISTFDIPFINSELKAANLNTLDNEIFDIYPKFKDIFGPQAADLDGICRKFKIDFTERKRNGHSALLDARLTASCYYKLKKIIDQQAP